MTNPYTVLDSSDLGCTYMGKYMHLIVAIAVLIDLYIYTIATYLSYIAIRFASITWSCTVSKMMAKSYRSSSDF